MVQCHKSHLDGCAPVHDYLLKKNLLGAEPKEPHKLYKERKGITDIKAVGLYKNFHDLMDERYHNKMCPKPALDVWIRVNNYYPIGTKIEQ